MRSELWPLLMRSHLSKHTRTSRQGAYLRKWHHHHPESHRGQGWLGSHLITEEIAPAKWLLHTLWGVATMNVTTDASLSQHSPTFSSYTWAGLIVHSITDRWMEQIMDHSISVTSYRRARYACLWQIAGTRVSGTTWQSSLIVVVEVRNLKVI